MDCVLQLVFEATLQNIKSHWKHKIAFYLEIRRNPIDAGQYTLKALPNHRFAPRAIPTPSEFTSVKYHLFQTNSGGCQ